MLVMMALASERTWYVELLSPVAAGGRGHQDQSSLSAMCWVVNLVISSSRTRGGLGLDPGSCDILLSRPRFRNKWARVGGVGPRSGPGVRERASGPGTRRVRALSSV